MASECQLQTLWHDRNAAAENFRFPPISTDAAGSTEVAFGFSFMLHQILRVDAPNVWHSLLAFNAGVEIGQLMIVLLVWPLVLFLRKQPGRIWVGSRGAVALCAAVIAMVWAVERAEFFL